MSALVQGIERKFARAPADIRRRISWLPRWRSLRKVLAHEHRGQYQIEANRETIREAFEAWKNGTGSITDVFAPEMVWRIEGHSAASKQYESRQQFVDEVLSAFGARFSALSDPFRPITVRLVHADGDTVIVLWDGRGTANDGKPYENSYAWLLKDARRQGRGRDRLLRQHLVQRALEPRATRLARARDLRVPGESVSGLT